MERVLTLLAPNKFFLGGAGRWAHGGDQWAVTVGDGVVGDVVHLLGEGHHGFEVLALAAVEVDLSLKVGFEPCMKVLRRSAVPRSGICSTSWLKLAMQLVTEPVWWMATNWSRTLS